MIYVLVLLYNIDSITWWRIVLASIRIVKGKFVLKYFDSSDEKYMVSTQR